MIPYGRHEVNQADIDAVVSVLQSDFLTQGPAVPKFEKAIAEYCGVSHALAVTNATSALHLACLSLGLGPEDILWTSPVTFVASANCALYCGAKVDFVDIDPNTYNISISALSKKLALAKIDGCLPKIIVAVHLSGQSCDMKSIFELSKIYGFKIVEDASHAIGGLYQSKPIGCCDFSDVCIFSFHPVKIITTAEGGMLLTNQKCLADKVALLRSHGITRDSDLMTKEPDGAWYYQQIDLGFNYRMTDLQAALGLSQLERLDQYVSRRNDIAKRYTEHINSELIQLPYVDASCYSAFHLYIVRVHFQDENLHKILFGRLREHGIGVNLHYIPVYLQPWFEKMGFSSGYCAEAERYYSQAISLPIFPSMTDLEQDEVCTTLLKLVHDLKEERTL